MTSSAYLRSREEKRSRRPFLLGLRKGLAIRPGLGWLFIAVFAVALVAGGASRLNDLPASIIEVAAALLLPFTALRWARAENTPPTYALVLFAVICAAPALQLIPLPPELWTALPGREWAVAVRRAADLPVGWAPLSLTPDLTLRSAAALWAPGTIFLAACVLTREERDRVIWLILIVTVASLCLGVVQITGDKGYLYEHTNRGSLVGFFANRNHQATLLLCTLPLLAALAAKADISESRRAGYVVLGCGALMVVVMALGAVQSRAGIVLAGLAVLGALAVLWRAGLFGSSKKWIFVVIATLLAAGSVVASLALPRLADRFGKLLDEDRLTIFPNVWARILDYLPVGSGGGSFDVIYRHGERLSQVAPEFINHAHNDFMEVTLEFGVVGVVLICLFVVSAVLLGSKAWREGGAQGRAGAIVVLLVLLHSMVDYPLRTLAISFVFAFACALFMAPTGRSRSRQRVRSPDTAYDRRTALGGR
jgi:O-antigen ligase